MTGIDFTDLIVVRRSVEKGTKTIEEKFKPSAWAGQSFREYEKDKLRKAGYPKLVSSKGTNKISINSLKIPPIPSTKGRFIHTGRGTSRMQLSS